MLHPITNTMPQTSFTNNNNSDINAMVSTIKNASHVVRVNAINELNQIKGETLLPTPDLSKLFDSHSLKLLDLNAFKYRENLNSLIYTSSNINNARNHMMETTNLRKSQSISLGSLGNPNKSISVFPPTTATQSIESSTTSSRSSTPFNFTTTSATPISQASSISLNDKFTKNIHYGSTMQDMSIPRTPIDLNNKNTNSSTPSSLTSKERKRSHSKNPSSHKKSKSVVSRVTDTSKDSLEQRRKYRCTVCSKGFTTSGHLARHNRIHTGEKNHACPYNNCKQRFSRQDNCLQHYRTHFKNNNGVSKQHEIITYNNNDVQSSSNRASGMNYYNQQ
ncbi:hypothetical protein C6P45_002247 [Maudiozyma exigua]|uniref:C2H2-type domain-containing protein n=1 Tax=Maudiozyma exigua TaxID=34358 RepID=A0A9P6WDY8_MAUEX|nr:hypothetical protein C6P45_002247 [Kazachstania exigua]